ncbi:protein-s-isoprenylcysteine o-methyltransferase a [Quercus suber]|uniref:Protein-S-isoprenylcysteine O-methyltransferase n=1 Tax=Quercus suber TaxID=58331 RepID=A0AAW0IR70_QUESU
MDEGCHSTPYEKGRLWEISFFKRLWGDLEIQFFILMLYSPAASSGLQLAPKQKTISWQCSSHCWSTSLKIFIFPGLKEHWWGSNLGLAVVIVGEIVRKTSIIIADQAITHLIRINHEGHHKLITHGIYRCVRHPRHCGFSIWSVGTQINAL